MISPVENAATLTGVFIIALANRTTKKSIIGSKC
jgi:hypothetical protein